MESGAAILCYLLLRAIERALNYAWNVTLLEHRSLAHFTVYVSNSNTECF